jgi:hypothetical protein
MDNPPETLSTDIEIDASQKEVAQILAAQYSDMSPETAKKVLERTNHPVWTTDEFAELFEVSHFDPPYVYVIRKTDNVRGTVAFIDTPRFYFAFQPEETNDARTP